MYLSYRILTHVKTDQRTDVYSNTVWDSKNWGKNKMSFSFGTINKLRYS